ncbi:MAG: recombinase family protein [Candidatus Paceibacterota bacterium]
MKANFDTINGSRILAIMKARYNRISTPNQKLERQLAKNNKEEKIYNDVISGSIPFFKRPMGKELKADIESKVISYVSVSSIDRLGRNLYNIIDTLRYFDNWGVTVRVDNLGLESRVGDKKNQTFGLIVSVMASVAQMERETLLERQAEGIALAKAKGVYRGRVRGSEMKDEEVLGKYKGVVKLLKQGLSVRKTAKLEDVSAGTVMKVKRLMDYSSSN